MMATLGINSSTKKYMLGAYNTVKGMRLCHQEIEHSVKRVIHSQSTSDQFTVWGPKYIAHININTQDQYFETKPVDVSFLEELEYLTAVAFQENSMSMAAVTNKNNIYFLRFNQKTSQLKMNPYEGAQKTTEQASNAANNPNLKSSKQHFDTNNRKIGSYQPTCVCSLPSGGFCVGFAGAPYLMTFMVLKEEKIQQKGVHHIEFDNFLKVESIHCDQEESHIVLAIQHSNRNIH